MDSIIGVEGGGAGGLAAAGRFVEATGIPFYTTPQSRGEIAEGGRVDLGLGGDARTVLDQLTSAVEGRLAADSFAAWRERPRGRNTSRAAENEVRLNSAETPIHPLTLRREIRDFMERDAVLVVDDREILNYGRQSISSHSPGHRINSGVFGTMGVGLPCGMGARVAKPDAQVIVLHRDGSFGLNALEMDTCVRHGLPVLVVISDNGGWTADPEGTEPGRDLGFTRCDKLAEAPGAYGERVTDPDGIRPAPECARAEVKAGRPALVNVEIDDQARATTADFTRYAT